MSIKTLLRSRLLYRCFSSESRPKICVIGSGPGGFYAAQHLLKAVPNADIDMYEKLPVPFGLVRYGVAPDHPEVKNVINTFTKTASNNNFKFIGNVQLGKHVRLKDFQDTYHAIILAYGCNEEKKLAIYGEEKMLMARRFVGWYNGLPEDKDLDVNLDSDVAVIIGQGNVAIDVARILLSPIDILKKTDITSYALEKLNRSRIKTVYLVGRRGPLQAAFTIKEFREMTKLPGVSSVLRAEDLSGIEHLLPDLPRPRKRLTELMLKTSTTEQIGDKMFHPIFFRKPSKVIFGSNVKGIQFSINDCADQLHAAFVSTEKTEEFRCGVGILSVGYKGASMDPDLPFDYKSGTIVSQTGIYSSGWICTGPVGVIVSTMANAFQQAAALVADIESNKINIKERKSGFEGIKYILNAKGVRTVSFEGWKRIDKAEVEMGEMLGKPREKIVDIEKMLEIGGD